jgi:glycosyltransferase involved in cell wall biosynthesis
LASSVHKNAEFVIRAVGLSRSKPVLQWVANRVHADYAESMTRLSRELGVTLQLKAGQSEAELVQHYQQGLALLYAPRLEPFGLAPLEANACGMPAIALAEGGVRETVVDGENGRLVDSPEEMAACLDEFVREPSRARALGQAGAAVVRRRWTLDAATDRLEMHLREIVEQGRS